MPTRIILADDHQIVREGLATLLEQEEDMRVVGTAADGRAAVKLAAELSPDVVVLDVGMPGLNGIEAARQITGALPAAKILALSMHSDRRFVLEMLRAGAAGYLLKDCAFDELAHAIRTIVAGQTYLSPRIAGVVVEGFLQQGEPGERTGAAALTPREREVLQLLAEGMATKQVAHHLGVSSKTIETHRRQIMTKLELDSVAELTKYAIREGLTSLEP